MIKLDDYSRNAHKLNDFSQVKSSRLFENFEKLRRKNAFNGDYFYQDNAPMHKSKIIGFFQEIENGQF